MLCNLKSGGRIGFAGDILPLAQDGIEGPFGKIELTNFPG
jgi:hypothetical protein